jgi:hypothetical protein
MLLPSTGAEDFSTLKYMGFGERSGHELRGDFGIALTEPKTVSDEAAEDRVRQLVIGDLEVRVR